jgi:hypothetical protein
MGEVRDARGRFRPGQTGNAGGRKPGLAAAARAAVGDDPSAIVEVLVNIALDTSNRAADRIRAAAEILDRGWGRPAQYAPIEGGDPLEQSELDAAIVSLIEQLRGRAGTPETN